MHRFRVSPEAVHNGIILITGEDHKHLSQVLRLEPGDRIGVFDGSGMEYEASLLSVEKLEARAEILSREASLTEPETKVTLFQGLLKGEKMDFVIQKAVELGIHQIVPVITQRTVVRLDDKERDKKAQRWNKIASEASKQCGRATVPTVLAPMDWKIALDKMQSFTAKVLLYENEQKKCLKEILKCYNINKIRDIALFIGPEGGFSQEEADGCLKAGIDTAGLGKRILRAETAAISVLSITMYEMGELQ